MNLQSLTSTGHARLIILVATAWIIVWGSIWGYSAYRTNSMDSWISAELDAAEKLEFELAQLEKTAPDPIKDEQIQFMADGIEKEMDRRDTTHRWVDRAKWTGPIGLAVILFSGIGGLWVFKGFRSQLRASQ